MKPKTIIILILIALCLVVLIQNSKEIVTFQIFFWKITMSRIILIPMLIFIGFIIGYLVAKLQK